MTKSAGDLGKQQQAVSIIIHHSASNYASILLHF